MSALDPVPDSLPGPPDDLPEVRPRRWRIGVGAAVVLVLGALGATVLVNALTPVGASTIIAPSAGAGGGSSAGSGAGSGPGSSAGAGSSGGAVSAGSTVGGDASGGAAGADAGGSAGEPLLVHVLGAVAAPGLYRLDSGARVVDAVAAAGGFTAEAERSSVNLARPEVDGEQLRVLAVGEQAPPDAGGADAGGAGGSAGSGGAQAPIDLNRADAAQLDELPRIGPATAARIIAYRDENGPFTAVDDLLEVPGIGAKTLDGLRDLVRV